MDIKHDLKLILVILVATMLLASVSGFSIGEFFGFGDEEVQEGEFEEMSNEDFEEMFENMDEDDFERMQDQMEEHFEEEGIDKSRYEEEKRGRGSVAATPINLPNTIDDPEGFDKNDREYGGSPGWGGKDPKGMEPDPWSDEFEENIDMQLISEEEEYPEEGQAPKPPRETEGKRGSGSDFDMTQFFSTITPMTITGQKMGPLFGGFAYATDSAIRLRTVSFDGNYKNVLYFIPDSGESIIKRKDGKWDFETYLEFHASDRFDYVEIVFPTLESAIAAKNALHSLVVSKPAFGIGDLIFNHANLIFWQTTTPCKPDSNSKIYCHVNLNKGDNLEITNDEEFIWKHLFE